MFKNDLRLLMTLINQHEGSEQRLLMARLTEGFTHCQAEMVATVSGMLSDLLSVKADFTGEIELHLMGYMFHSALQSPHLSLLLLGQGRRHIPLALPRPFQPFFGLPFLLR